MPKILNSSQVTSRGYENVHIVSKFTMVKSDTATVRFKYGQNNERMVNSCYLFTVQPVVGRCDLIAGWNIYSLFRLFVGLSVFSCGRYFLVGSLDVCYSSFYLFLLFSFAFEYLLLISMEMALILLSRSCFVAAFCCSSAWDLK